MALTGLRDALAVPRLNRRTLLGVALAATAGFLVLILTRPAPTMQVLVAADDIPAGTPLDEGLVTTRAVSSARGLVESGSLGELVGWSLVVPLAAGEPLLPSLLEPPQVAEAGAVLSVVLEESHAALGRIGAGDEVDIYVTWQGSTGEPRTTELLAAGVYVVDAMTGDGSLAGGDQVQVLVAVDDALALDLTRAGRLGELDMVRKTP